MNSNPSSLAADNLKLINGIGPAIERHLHEGGILTFAKLATVRLAELADLVGLSVERIDELDWIGQARKLALESTSSEKAQPDMPSTGDGQHHVSFTLKLLLNEDHSVRRTQVVDNRSKVEEQWASWDEPRVIDFISRQADLQIPVVDTPKAESAATTVVESVLTEPTAPEPAAAVPVLAGFGGSPYLRELKPTPAGTTGARRVFRHGLPFSVQMQLDLSEVELPNDDPLEYTATVFARKLGGGSRKIIGEVHDTIAPKDQLTIFAVGNPLQQGSYRLDALVTLSHPAAELDLRAYQEGGMLQIY